jgi:putative transposase
MAAARQFFEGAMDLHGVPEKITIDKSASNTAAIQSIRDDSGVDIELRQSKYLNNIVEQDHRAIKRLVRLMLGFKTFRCARAVIAGIETMHMIKKGQLNGSKDRAWSAADKFYSLAF